MKTSSKYIALAAIAFGLAACTQEEEFAPQQSDIVQIATANIATEVHSRVNTLDDGENFESNDQILLVNNSRSNKNSGTYTVTFSGETTTWSLTNGMVLWSSGTETNNFTAYYPATETFTLPTDQSSEDGIKSADRMVATTNGVAKGDAVALNFKRQNAKVTITPTMASQYTGGTICDFMIGGVKPYTSANGYTAILEPTESGFTVSLKVSSDKLTATSTQELEAGKHYTFNLTVGKAAVTLDGVNVDNWNSATLEGGVAEEIPYLTFTVGGEQSLVLNVAGTLNSTIQYSADGEDWTNFETSGVVDEYGMSTTTPVFFKNNLRMRGQSEKGTFEPDYDAEKINGFMISFTENTSVTCSGDIRTLVDYTNYETTSTENARFANLFAGCSALADASKLKLISNNNKMAASCYEYMFSGCESLTSAPALPATTLAASCYEYMFLGCESLTSAPELPATTLAESCYKSMFSGCESLTSAPELPAKTLASYCYVDMFNSCTSLTSAPELRATTLAKSCYVEMFAGCSNLTTAPAQLPAPTLADNCYANMFASCSKLESAPVLPATTLANYCYWQMFSDCRSLESAPELPAKTLVAGCYYKMFNGCTSLNSVTMLATDISATDCLKDWVYGVSSIGTFTKAASMASLPTGANGIPERWGIINVE